MAQLVAHLHGMQGVRGSSPLSSTKPDYVSTKRATRPGGSFCLAGTFRLPVPSGSDPVRPAQRRLVPAGTLDQDLVHSREAGFKAQGA